MFYQCGNCGYSDSVDMYGKGRFIETTFLNASEQISSKSP